MFSDQFTYSCGRVSPVWPVDDRAKTAEERPRTNALAKHKDFHRDFLPERYLPNPLSQAAVRRSLSSERLESLSRPRYKRESQFRDSMWEVGSYTCTSSDGLMEPFVFLWLSVIEYQYKHKLF